MADERKCERELKALSKQSGKTQMDYRVRRWAPKNVPSAWERINMIQLKVERFIWFECIYMSNVISYYIVHSSDVVISLRTDYVLRLMFVLIHCPILASILGACV